MYGAGEALAYSGQGAADMLKKKASQLQCALDLALGAKSALEVQQHHDHLTKLQYTYPHDEHRLA